MERGLLWLPLLGVFIWLAVAGWNEYQKVEAYRIWAADFERAKYDIYAVLGQKGSEISWGKPTRTGPVQVETFSLEAVKSIRVLVDGEAVEPLPTKARSVALEFVFADQRVSVCIPFTEVELAAKWAKALQQWPGSG